MTIQGAMNELVNLLNAEDIPIYYKGGIKKVIETIDDYIDGKDDYVNRKTEPHACEGCPYHEQCCQEDWRSCRYDYVSERYIEPQTEREGDNETD